MALRKPTSVRSCGSVTTVPPRGRALEPVLLALGRWGRLVPFPDGAAPIGTDAVVLALPTTFVPERARGFTADVGLRLGVEAFRARVRRGRVDVSREGAGGADAVLATDAPGLADLLWHGDRLGRRDGRVEGDRAKLTRFLTLFSP